MAKMIKVIRAGTVQFVEEEKLDFYLSIGYEIVQPKKPAVIKVQLVSNEPEERPVQPFEAEKPKRKARTRKAAK